jgi:hypothetical protein
MPAHRKDGEPSRKQVSNGSRIRGAELYVENMYNGGKKTDREVLVEAGFSPTSNTTHIIAGKHFQELLNKLIPKDKILKRIDKGLGDKVKDSTALGYCRLGAEIHGLVGPKANVNNINVENANMLIGDLLNYKPPGLASPDEFTEI